DTGDTLAYTWTFGDGSASQTTTSPATTHTYGAMGPFTATLVVKDNHGATSPADTIVLAAGNTPPTVPINSPAAGTQFVVGQKLTLSATASDAQDGSLPGSAISWTVLRHHAEHT